MSTDPEYRPCRLCGTMTLNRVGEELTPGQVAENEAWVRSFRLGPHTGHCPHLMLPPQPVCEGCALVVDVMGS